MAILEKEVWVGLGGNKNAKYFETLGYDIPRIKSTYGKFIVPRGAKILVKVDDLSKSSDIKVTKICDDCGKHLPNQTYDSIIRLRKNNDGNDRCFDCGKKKARITILNNIKYENSLELYVKENRKEYLLKEYSIKNNKRPNEISYGSGQEYLWDCPKCSSEYQASADSRTNMSSGCPYCRGFKVNHTNSLANKNPEIAKLLTDPKIGHGVTSGSNKKVKFTCPDCGNIDKKQVNSVVRYKYVCSKCSDGISYPEKFMFNVLNQINAEFETQKIFNWAIDKRFDFYINSLNCIIETHGAQHYIYTGFDKSLEEEKENDKLKEKLANKNGIIEYFIIDCRKSDLDFIKNSIISSELPRLFNLNKVDFNKCHEYACSNLIKTISGLWNEGIESTVEIGKIVKLERSTVVRHLKRAKKLGWCKYDPKETQRQSGKLSGSMGKKEVVQLTKENVFITQWDSISEAANFLSIEGSNISYACNGKYDSCGGFRWFYKEDYKKLIENKDVI